MAVLSDYTSGTITVANGSVDFTGTGTLWRAAKFREGDTVQLGGYTGVIAGTSLVDPLIESDTAGKFVDPWPGPSGTFAYRMRYLPDGARVTAQTTELIEMLGNGNLEALAALTPEPNANAVPVFTGPGATVLRKLGEEFLTANGFSNFMAGLRDRVDGPALYGAMGSIPNAQVRNDLTADKAYRRGNILGTVSQAAGVPTGALIERGSNGNGEYVRYADGTQICLSPLLTPTANVASGSLFRSAPVSQPFPAVFAATPHGFGHAGADGGWVNAQVASATGGWTSVAWATFQGGVFVRLGAIGRWF